MHSATPRRRAKIVATIGPATESEEKLAELLAAGVDVVRLNLSHGSHDWHRERLRLLRRIAERTDRLVPMLLDVTGPRFRLGTMEDRVLEAGETVVLALPDDDPDLPVDDPDLLRQLDAGERVLIDQGLVELAIRERDGRRVTAQVVVGGPVSTRKGLNLPDTDIGFRVTDKDRRDIELAVAEKVDYLAASYIGSARDVRQIRACVREAGGDIPLIAKLERPAAVDNLDEILAVADGVMVARGDLGVEVPLPRVPAIQKRIVHAGRRLGKPVIVATQMLESMTEQPRPTRAEATDVANAALDGADALMLSGETAVGRYPVETVATMVRIIEETEDFSRRELPGLSDLRRGGQRGGGRPGGGFPGGGNGGADGALGRLADEAVNIPDMVSAAAVYSAREAGASRLVAFSQSGATARLVARYRPSVPIDVFTNRAPVARGLRLLWGVTPHLLEEELTHHDEVIELMDRELLGRELATPGDLIVVVMGDPIREQPQTNLMRIHRVRRKPGAEVGAKREEG